MTCVSCSTHLFSLHQHTTSMSSLTSAILLLVLSVGVQQTSGVEVKVNDVNGTLCLFADLMVNFSVSYQTTDKKMAVVKFQLPSTVVANSSSCGTNSSLLKLDFEDGHSWSMSFTSDGRTYQATSLVFSYNLNDMKLFPNSSSNATVEVTVKPDISGVDLDTKYSCRSSEMLSADSVNQTLFKVQIQAFIPDGHQSTNSTNCAADKPTPIPTPTKHPVTTPTTPTAPTTPTPTLPTPSTGHYNVTPVNGSVCLLLQLGLRLGIKQGDKYQEINLNNSRTTVSGSCDTNRSQLILESDTMKIDLIFVTDKKKFHLQAVNASVKLDSGVFKDANNSLSLWQASVGSSYMCSKEQNFSITSKLSVFTFQLQVQPFQVKKGSFSTAQECSLDDTSVLIPIVVGAALAALILVVVIAYVIGRRKTYVGYQTL